MTPASPPPDPPQSDQPPRGRRSRAAREPDTATPWSEIDRHPDALAVEHFPVALIVQLGNALRRTVTTPYAEQFGLSESEWRMFTLVVNFTPLNMVDLVSLSTSDKALVSRSVKALREKRLIEVRPDPGGHQKRLICVATARGIALHDRIFPLAQREQAKILAPLTREERDSLFRCLLKLNRHHVAAEEPERLKDGPADPD